MQLALFKNSSFYQEAKNHFSMPYWPKPEIADGKTNYLRLHTLSISDNIVEPINKQLAIELTKLSIYEAIYYTCVTNKGKIDAILMPHFSDNAKQYEYPFMKEVFNEIVKEFNGKHAGIAEYRKNDYNIDTNYNKDHNPKEQYRHGIAFNEELNESKNQSFVELLEASRARVSELAR
jgi:hypothetical protein